MRFSPHLGLGYAQVVRRDKPTGRGVSFRLRLVLSDVARGLAGTRLAKLAPLYFNDKISYLFDDMPPLPTVIFYCFPHIE